MNREAAFLLAAVRRFLRPESPLPQASSLDWDRLAAMTSAHTVVPQLYLAVKDSPVPPDWLARLREQFEAAGRFNLALSSELVRLLWVLEREGIAAVPLKGPALAVTLYGNLALRASSDLDLLVHPCDFPRVRSLLACNGYRQTSVQHWPGEAPAFRARERQISFLDASGAFSVDVHWHPLPAYIPENFETERVWATLQSIVLGGRELRTLAPGYLLLYLCAHGGKHGWERLAWICDLARLLQLETALDWDAVFEEARRTRTRRMLATGLLVAGDLLGSDLPVPAARFVAGIPQARALADDVWSRFEDSTPIPTPALDMTGFCLRLFDTPGQRLRLLFGTWIAPSEADYRTLKLPPVLFPLYYAYRPLRLVARRLLGRSRW